MYIFFYLAIDQSSLPSENPVLSINVTDQQSNTYSEGSSQGQQEIYIPKRTTNSVAESGSIAFGQALGASNFRNPSFPIGNDLQDWVLYLIVRVYLQKVCFLSNCSPFIAQTAILYIPTFTVNYLMLFTIIHKVVLALLILFLVGN